MFYGEHEHTIDRKGRLIIPAKFRAVLKDNAVERLFLTRGLDGCLFLFTEEEWRRQESKFKSISFTRGEARKFNRLYFSGAVEADPDRQGRVLLPKTLKDFAQIKQDVVFVGVSTHVEIWARERWQEFFESSRSSFEDIAEHLLEG